jgi:tRNA threonylcarbamoyladenosine biosynthesis protein TsaB
LSAERLVLAVDTCGSSGSIALARLDGDEIVRLGERAIAGGEFASLLVPAIAELLAEAGVAVGDLAGLVVVAGPGSFTGIRVGMAVVKAMAEAAQLPVVTVSRLALLAALGAASTSVLDAHRGQLYCGMYGLETTGAEAKEMLLTAGEINALGGLTGKRAGRVAVCEETVAQLLEELCGEPEIVRVAGPTAYDALKFSAEKWRGSEFADVATLDGYYLRGADAKVSGRL